jgi:hydroxymethylbilane synthase
MSSDRPYRLGTRGSQLALWQAHMVAGLLAKETRHAFEIVVIKTSGDRLQDRPLSEVGGKSLFVKEIEESMLSGAIDLAVHSSKDMPAVLPDGLSIAGVLPREDPRDAVVLPASSTRQPPPTLENLVSALGPNPSIGTGSVRRVAQLTRIFPDATFAPIRGNLDTRLQKLDRGEHQALVLAAAGLRRLGSESRISFRLPTEMCVPAPGQAIVAVETRTADTRLQPAMDLVTDANAAAALRAERSLVAALGGGCQTPIGALATPSVQGELELIAVVISIDGSRVVRTVARGSTDRADGLGKLAAGQLLERGAGEILEEAQRAQERARHN